MKEYTSPLEMLYKWEKQIPDQPFLKQPRDGQWHTWTWKEAGQEIRKVAAMLKGLDLPPGSNIAMISKNCSYWIMSDLAIAMAGHVSVPLYPNLNAETVNQIMKHSGSKVLLVGKLDDYEAMRPGVPDDVYCISFPHYGPEDYDNWADLIKEVEPLQGEIVREPDELNTIIYTSGTTGTPKGVMHNFKAFGFSAYHAVRMINASNNDRFFSYLPLSHIAERLLTGLGGIYTGGTVYFAESLDTFAQNLQYAQPTIFLGVPRIWTKFRDGILSKMPQKRLNTLLSIPLVNNLIRNKIKKGLGLNKTRLVLTGAAPTPESIFQWFEKLGIEIKEAYGMTENCAYSHFCGIDNPRKPGYIGPPMPGVEVKLDPTTHEVLVKSDATMIGYYKEPEMTKETITPDGFLRTGDEGEIDEQGRLRITGRVKDLFKTSKGKYVAPSPIEMKLSSNKFVEQVCLVGDNIPQPIALVVLSESGREREQQHMAENLAKTLEIVNPQLDRHEQVKKVVVVKDEWTVENTVLTPSMKIRRKMIDQWYRDRYEGWYEHQEAIIWE